MLADPWHESAALDEAHRRAQRSGRPVLVSSTRQVAPGDALALFEQAHERDRALWLRPASGEAMVGLGAAHVVTIDESQARFAAASRAWSELLGDAVVDDPAGLLWTGPVLLGGFRFDPLQPRTVLWSGFGGDRLVLPERLFVQRRGSAWLTINRLVGAPEPISRPQTGLQPARRGLPPNEWQALVGSVAHGIQQHDLGVDKVVLARTVTLQRDRAFEAADALRNLAATYPTCTLFGIAHAEACFVGATPERLVGVTAGLATTMALAGSIGRGQTALEDQALGQALLSDAKERSEHDFVVSALRAGLAQVSTRVIADAEPRLRKLANVQHLLTPVHGQLAPGRGILDVLERLHPTPAVGGVPSDRALALIRERENLDRGWYAGPIGWVNRAGEGEFVVAIRSALLRGGEACLFSGCGIVAGSHPPTELTESNWKLRPMLSALGSAESA